VSIVRIEPGQRLANAVVHGGLVHLAGHVAHDTSTDTRDQTRQVLEAIDAHLAAAGTDKSRLLSVQIWLADIDTFPEMNAAWDAWVDRANLPARATVQARLASPDWRVEIAGIAAI
jgi:enamine deaminase RidA (YjgF/YER057c/UK114 family)